VLYEPDEVWLASSPNNSRVGGCHDAGLGSSPTTDPDLWDATLLLELEQDGARSERALSEAAIDPVSECADLREDAMEAAMEPAAEDKLDRVDRVGVGGAAIQRTSAELRLHSEPPEAADPAVSNKREGGVGTRTPLRSREGRHGVGARIAEEPPTTFLPKHLT